VTPHDLFPDNPLALELVGRLAQLLPGAEVRVSKSQVAFWHHHGFAYVWAPG
jgi:hypothetical protein